MSSVKNLFHLYFGIIDLKYGTPWSNEIQILIFNFIKSEKDCSSKLIPKYPSHQILIILLSNFLLKYVYIFPSF